jgi:hypothetical protein
MKSVAYNDAMARLTVSPSVEDTEGQVCLVMSNMDDREFTLYLPSDEARELAADLIELADRADALAKIEAAS